MSMEHHKEDWECGHNSDETQCHECGECCECGCDCERVNAKVGDKAFVHLEMDTTVEGVITNVKFNGIVLAQGASVTIKLNDGGDMTFDLLDRKWQPDPKNA